MVTGRMAAKRFPRHEQSARLASIYKHDFCCRPKPSNYHTLIQNRSRIVALASGREHHSLMKNAVIGVASAAALTGAAVLLMRDRTKDEPRVADSNWHPGWRLGLGLRLGLGFGFRPSADAEVAFIEARRAKEAAEELAKWDTRYVLRNKTSLGELRQLAA